MAALDAGAEDFSEEEDSYEVITDPDNFSAFNLQIYFLNKRFHDVVEISRSEQTIVQDRTIFEDARIFAPNLQSSSHLPSFSRYLPARGFIFSFL